MAREKIPCGKFVAGDHVCVWSRWCSNAKLLKLRGRSLVQICPQRCGPVRQAHQHDERCGDEQELVAKIRVTGSGGRHSLTLPHERLRKDASRGGESGIRRES